MLDDFAGCTTPSVCYLVFTSEGNIFDQYMVSFFKDGLSDFEIISLLVTQSSLFAVLNGKLVVFLQIFPQLFHAICMGNYLTFFWIESKCHIDGEVWLSPKNELIRRESSGVIFGYIVCMNERREMITPFHFVLLESSQHLQEHSIESLNRITTRVVRSCPCLLYSQLVTKVFDEGGLKIPTLVTMKTFG